MDDIDFIYINNALYNGQIRKTDKIPHGQGIIIYKNGDQYQGSFQNGLKEGIGNFQSKIGFNYNGNFYKDNFHGFGRLDYPCLLYTSPSPRDRG